jgi:putative GTP pyrophosphokinase
MTGEAINWSMFLKTYNLENDVLDKTGLAPSNLEAIYSDHLSNTKTLETTADYIAARLRQVNEVHSLKIRIKDPEHLIEKIIRKKAADPTLDFTLDNYKERITDLIGVRALHLFKEDWSEIHDFIARTWQLHEQPTANVRKGDSEEYTQQFVEKGCKINEHKLGYRSVHYLLVSQPAKEQFITEVQVRTIFEEGWSEIDHRIRYPYDLGNTVLTQLSAIHNRLAGSADEIGSFIKFLKKELRIRDEQITEAIAKHDEAVKELNDYVQKLELSNIEKKELEQRLKSLTTDSRTTPLRGGLNSVVQALSGLTVTAAVVEALKQQQATTLKPASRKSAVDHSTWDMTPASAKPAVLTTARAVQQSVASLANGKASTHKEGVEQKSPPSLEPKKKSQRTFSKGETKPSKKDDKE